MCKEKILITITFLLTINGLYCQENKKEGVFDEKIALKDTIIFKDTIKLFLDDTSYYLTKSISELTNEHNEKIGYFKYFINTHGLEFELKKLPDGFYCLYNITKKQAKKVGCYDKYFVASGEYKDGMRQGAFIFMNIPENPNWVKAFKKITFKNDTVHGVVKEMGNDKVLYLAEYNMGIKNGFCYYAEVCPLIILYKDGIIIRETFFE